MSVTAAQRRPADTRQRDCIVHVSTNAQRVSLSGKRLGRLFQSAVRCACTHKHSPPHHLPTLHSPSTIIIHCICTPCNKATASSLCHSHFPSHSVVCCSTPSRLEHEHDTLTACDDIVCNAGRIWHRTDKSIQRDCRRLDGDKHPALAVLKQSSQSRSAAYNSTDSN